MYRKLSLLSILFLLLLSCSKDEQGPPSEGARLRRVIAAGEVQTEYFYNAKGLISRLVSKNTSETNYYYNQSNKLVKKDDIVNYSNSSTVQQWSKSYTEYVYDDKGRVSLEKTYLERNGQYQLESKMVPAYDAAGKLISAAATLADDTPSQLYKYQYNSKGNIQVQEIYGYKNGQPVINFKYSYDEFDDKQNPYKNILYGVLPYFVNDNNIKHTTTYNYNIYPGTVETTMDVSEYKSYNGNGLPLEIAENGTVFTYQYE